MCFFHNSIIYNIIVFIKILAALINPCNKWSNPLLYPLTDINPFGYKQVIHVKHSVRWLTVAYSLFCLSQFLSIHLFVLFFSRLDIYVHILYVKHDSSSSSCPYTLHLRLFLIILYDYLIYWITATRIFFVFREWILFSFLVCF